MTFTRAYSKVFQGVFIVTLGTNSIAWAATSQEDLNDLSLSELLKIPITGASLSEESQLTVPASVTIFTHQQLRLLGVEYLDELANLVPGYQAYRVADTPVLYPITARGRRISTFGTELLIMIDGLRIEGPGTGGATDFLARYPIALIEKVEFIRGSTAAIYGAEALMGVINITTRRQQNTASFYVGDHDSKNVLGTLHHAFDSMDLDIAYSWDKDNGDDYGTIDNISINSSDPREIININLRIGNQASYANVQYYEHSAEDFFEFEGLSNGFNEHKTELTTIALHHKLTWLPFDSSLSLQYAHSNYVGNAELLPFGALNGVSQPSSDDPLRIKAIFEDSESFTLNWINGLTLADSTLHWGFEYKYTDIPTGWVDNNFDLGDIASGASEVRYYGEFLRTTPVQQASDRKAFGLYTEYQKSFDKSQITLGARYDDIEDFDTQISPRAALVYLMNERQALKLIYGEAYRAPAEAELFIINNPVRVGNPDLEAEEIKSWDLIWIGGWSDLNFSLGYFYSSFDNAVVEDVLDSGLKQISNSSIDPVSGIEAEIGSQQQQGWYWRAAMTHLNNKPDVSRNSADNTASLTLGYNSERYSISLINTYADQRDLSGENSRSLEGTRRSDLKAIYSIRHNIKAVLMIKNLEDETLLSPASTLNFGIPERGREISLGIELLSY